MANYGIGIGAFTDGFVKGMSIGEKYRSAKKDWDAEQVRTAELDAARQAREAEINKETDRLMANGPQGPAGPNPDAPPVRAEPAPQAAQPSAAPAVANEPAPASAAPTPAAARAASSGIGASQPVQMPSDAPASAMPAASAPPASQSPDSAGSASSMGMPQQLMTREQARAAAEKSAPTVLQLFQKKGVPKIAETYLAQGDMVKAEAWTKWAEQADSQRDMKTWAKAYRSAQLGDVEGAANHVFELYKSYADGSTPVSKEVVKDKDGNVTGFNVKLRDDATKEERSAFVGKDELLNMGLAALSPPQMFEQAWKQKQTLDKAKADAAAKAGEIKMQTAKELAVENVRQGGRVQLAGINAQNDQSREAQKHEYDLERDVQKGKIDGQNQRNKVQQELEAKLGALKSAGYSDEFIQNAVPEILGMGQYKRATSPEEAKRLAFSDRMKNDPTFGRKSAEKQRELIEQDMKLIYGGVKPTGPANSGAAPKSGGPVIVDTKTGKIVNPRELPPRQ